MNYFIKNYISDVWQGSCNAYETHNKTPIFSYLLNSFSYWTTWKYHCRELLVQLNLHERTTRGATQKRLLWTDGLVKHRAMSINQSERFEQLFPAANQLDQLSHCYCLNNNSYAINKFLLIQKILNGSKKRRALFSF